MSLNAVKSCSGGFIIFDIFFKEIDDITLLWGVFILFSKMDGKLASVIGFIAERKIEENVVL